MPIHPPQKPSADDGNEQMSPSTSTAKISSKERTTKSTSNNTSFRIHWNIVAAVFLGIAAFTGASALVWKSAEWIRTSIDENVTAKLNDEKVLRQIAEHVRPALIFDANESITEDMGAASYIADNGKGIHMTKEPDGWPRHIHIDFTKQFANPPILTSMYEVTVIIPKRGKGFSWDFDVSDVVQHGQGISTNLWLYRLELVP
jgi:hypothetical protein